MITDTLKNIHIYDCISGNLVKGFNFLLNTNLNDLTDGKHSIQGEDIFASVSSYQTKEFDVNRWEAHKKFIDIQVLTQGSEKIFYAPVDFMNKEVIAYNPEKDIMFFNGEGNCISIIPSQFVLLFPTDAHQPCIINNKIEFVKKIVIKVKI